MKTKKVLLSVLKIFLYGAGVTAYIFLLTVLGGKRNTSGPSGLHSNAIDTSFIRGWKYSPEDNPEYAGIQCRDSAWITINSDSFPSSWSGKPAWFRLHFELSPRFLNIPYVFLLNHQGASELYLDGQHLADFGSVSSTGEQENNMNPHNFPVNVTLSTPGKHVLAIRYSNINFRHSKSFSGIEDPGFTLRMGPGAGAGMMMLFERQISVSMICVGIFLLTLTFVHFLLYLFYRAVKENLYYSIFSLIYGTLFLTAGISIITTSPYLQILFSKLQSFLLNPLLFLSLLLFVYYVFHGKFQKQGWIAVAGGLVGVLHACTDWISVNFYFVMIIWLAIFSIFTMVFGTWKAVKQKKPGARILGAGVFIFAFFIFFLISMMFYSKSGLSWDISSSGRFTITLIIGSLLSIPLSMSVYLAYIFSTTNRSLENKLKEVETLSANAIQQEREKQEILSGQKEMLEVQVRERTHEILEQKAVIEEKNKDITDSINYARRIQQTLLASDTILSRNLAEHFILFKPKDIVSGDFYWTSDQEEHFYLAVCDSTGHGVPGAFMSLLNISFMNEAVSEKKITAPHEIFNYVRKRLIGSISADGGKDGMDGILICFHKASGKITYAAAHNGPVLIRNGQLTELPADKMPVGKGEKESGFSLFTIDEAGGGMLYCYTDGFADQFGGDKGKKFKYRQLLEKFMALSTQPLGEQKESLDLIFETWKGHLEQIDDVLVIGMKMN